MLDLLLNSLIISLFIVGIHISMEEGMIFGSIHKLKLPEILAKPLYSCHLCMASVWGTIGFIALYELNQDSWIPWILTIVICIPLNGIIFGIFRHFE